MAIENIPPEVCADLLRDSAENQNASPPFGLRSGEIESKQLGGIASQDLLFGLPGNRQVLDDTD